jgi:epsilon-lactone hydrolase
MAPEARYSAQVEARLDDWRNSLADLLDILAGAPAERSLNQLRADYIVMLNRHGRPDGIRVVDAPMGVVPALRVSPDGLETRRHVIYFHGGAYIFGGPEGYVGLAGRIALALGAHVYLPDYRLAPEFPYPAPIDDCVDAYAWLLDQGIGAREIAFAGDSAGGTLTVTVMTRALRRGLPVPAAGVPMSPWCDLEHKGDSMRSRHGIDPLCTRDALDLQARVFLGGARPTNPDASPVNADLRGLPPILVQIGEAEVMMSGAIDLARNLAESGVFTELQVWPDMFHVWHLFAEVLPEGQRAIDSLAAFIGARFDAMAGNAG